MKKMDNENHACQIGVMGKTKGAFEVYPDG
jgi:hypothetical protein